MLKCQKHFPVYIFFTEIPSYDGRSGQHLESRFTQRLREVDQENRVLRKQLRYYNITTSESHKLCGVMVSIFSLSAVNCRFELWSDLIKDYKIGFCCFSTKHEGVRTKTGFLRIRIMCSSGATCLPMDLLQ